MNTYEVLKDLYDPHVTITCKKSETPRFDCQVHMLKNGAGAEIGKLFPDLTGIALSRAIVNVTSDLTVRIRKLMGIDKVRAMNIFAKECADEMETQFPTQVEMLDDYVKLRGEAYTIDLKAKDFLLSPSWYDTMVKEYAVIDMTVAKDGN